MDTKDSSTRLPRALLRSLILSVTASAMGNAWVAAALGIPLTMFMVRLGASGFQLGLLMAVLQFAVIAQIPSSIVAEGFRSRRHYWGVMATIHRALWFTPALLPLIPMTDNARIWIFIVVVAFSSAAAHSATVPWFSWMADLVPERISGRFWGARQSVVMTTFVAGAWAAGWVLDRYSGAETGNSMNGFVLVFGVGAILGLADVFIHWAVTEPPYRHNTEGTPPMQQIRTAWRDPDFRWFTLSMGLWMFAMGLSGSFGLVYIKQAFGASYSALSALSVAAALGALCAGIPMGILIDRIGARSIAQLIMTCGPALGALPWLFMSPGMATSAVSVAGMSFPAWLMVIMPFNFLLGGLYSGVGLSQVQLANAIAPRFGRLLPLAAHWSISGVLAALGPICGGVMMDVLVKFPPHGRTPGGMPLTFFHVQLVAQVLLCAAVAAPALRRVKERGIGLPRNMVMTLLRLGNPIRLLTSLYNVSIVRLLPREDKEE